jgi:hypothetical protein
MNSKPMPRVFFEYDPWKRDALIPGKLYRMHTSAEYYYIHENRLNFDPTFMATEMFGSIEESPNGAGRFNDPAKVPAGEVVMFVGFYPNNEFIVKVLYRGVTGYVCLSCEENDGEAKTVIFKKC